jgi:CRP/FNR family cyclic AMP-dependent transcriptional regulator
MFGEIPLFANLSKNHLKALAESGREKTFNQGDTIVKEGDMGVGFYLITEGSAQVKKRGRVLATLGRGQFFGEMSLLDNQPRSADVVAVGTTECFVLSAPAFWSMVSTDPKLARAVVQELTRRLRETTKSLSA